MSEAVILSLITTVPLVLAALATLVVSWRTGRKANEIHTMVNSNLSEVKTQLNTANERIERLLLTMTGQEQKAEQKAVEQTAAMHPVPVSKE